MVARIRAERRNIAPEALTKQHLATANNDGENNNTANDDGDNDTTTESAKAEKEPNFVSGLIKRLSDQTTFELVCRWQIVKKGYSNLTKLSLQ